MGYSNGYKEVFPPDCVTSRAIPSDLSCSWKEYYGTVRPGSVVLRTYGKTKIEQRHTIRSTSLTIGGHVLARQTKKQESSPRRFRYR